MRSTISLGVFIAVVVVSLWVRGQKGIPYPPAALAGARQAIVVTTPHWNSVDGKMFRYEKRGAAWEQVGSAVAVVVGKSGLGWAHDLATGQDGPAKREGDGRSPAGIFPVTQLFGFAPASSNPHMSYRELTASTECVDDVNSANYARIVDAAATAKDWSSSEHMRDIDVYRSGAVVAYNLNPTTRAAGSCIFLHIWNGPGRGTAGCTAMDSSQLETLLGWLDSHRHPVLIQLPEGEYQRLRDDWRLP